MYNKHNNVKQKKKVQTSLFESLFGLIFFSGGSSAMLSYVCYVYNDPRENKDSNIWFLMFLNYCLFSTTDINWNIYLIYLFSEYISRVVNTQNRRMFAGIAVNEEDVVTGGFLQTRFLYRTDSEWRTSRTRVLNKTIKISELDTKQRIKQHLRAL